MFSFFIFVFTFISKFLISFQSNGAEPATIAPMDVSPDFDTPSSSTSSDKKVSSTAVCLPFSLVPGMDISSKSYQKAVITLGKQKAGTSNKNPLSFLTDRGMLHLISLYFDIDIFI